MSVPNLRIVSAAMSDVSAAMLLVPVFEQDSLDGLEPLDAASRGDVRRAIASLEFRAKPFDVYGTTLAGWQCARALLVGAGAPKDWTPERARRLAAAGALAARARGAGDVALVVRPEPTAESVQAAADGLVLAAFDADVLKTTPREAAALSSLQVVVTGDAAAWAVVGERGRVLGACANIARRLANEPANRLPPRVFAEHAVTALEGAAVSVEVLDENRIRQMGMGLLLGVAQGSEEPPRLIVIRYTPSGASPDGPVLGLVGKGITFDTGGISIKPADGMDRMKTDMSGGAAVIGAMRAIGLLGAPIRVIGVVPAAENMPSGRAMRPGDVLTSASGKTVEINNTDAEGRLILGDALWYARELGATHLVDVATLTGACAVALGRHVSGLFGSDETWVGAVRHAAARAGDRVWPLPIYDEALEQMRSDIADLVNSAGRYGGASTAAAFLKEFAGDRPWAHLDIAGTAWTDEAKPHQPKGATGVALRTLAELAFSAGQWSGTTPTPA